LGLPRIPVATPLKVKEFQQMISRPLRVPWLVEAKMWRHPSTLGPEVHPALASNEFGLFLPMALLASAYLADKRFSKVGMWPKPRKRSPKKKIG
jgi:hypothetical protein